MAAGSTKQVRHGRDHGANNAWFTYVQLCSSVFCSNQLPARLELLNDAYVLYVRERAWLFRHSNAPECRSCGQCHHQDKTRETWWVRDPCRCVGNARDRRKKRHPKRLMRRPSPRHAQLGRALAVRDGGMGEMDGGFCGAGLALALSLTGEGSVIWAVVDTNSTVRRRGRARGKVLIVCLSMLLLEGQRQFASPFPSNN